MPTVGGTKFPYTKAGMQKAKAWSEMTGKPMEKEYEDGGTVHLRDTRNVLDPSSLEEVAHKRIPGGSVARYTAQTKAGDERNLARYIPGEGGKTKRRQVTTEGIRSAIRDNPDYADTLSLQEAKDFMDGDAYTKRELLELIMKLFGG
tara:strand:- start:9605 stop:10045 length:441 start_codon:yes stop_codon:yes gene_type:complete